MKALYSIYCITLSLLLINCEPAVSPYDTDIIGSWKQDSWVIVANNRPINRQMDFTFTEDKHYTVDYGSELEKGQYWFIDDDLFTQEDGREKKKVRIVKLSPDTLIFNMNRGGQIEQVSYVR